MSILPLTIRLELADHLDTTTATGLGYLRFAAELRLGVSLAYTAQQIANIRVSKMISFRLKGAHPRILLKIAYLSLCGHVSF